MIDDPQALEERTAPRDGFEKSRGAWRDKYGTDLRSDDARAALQEIHDGDWDDMRSLLETYGVDVREGAGPGFRIGEGGGMMRSGNGGGNDQDMGHCGGMTESTTN